MSQHPSRHYHGSGASDRPLHAPTFLAGFGALGVAALICTSWIWLPWIAGHVAEAVR